MNTNINMDTPTSINKNISFTNDICADGICCFMSIPRKQNHLGVWKAFLKRGNASYGIKLLYTSLRDKDIIYNPCRCLEFYLKEVSAPNGSNLHVLVRCGIFGKKCRPYMCGSFPDKIDSFMYDIPAPCAYNEYLASSAYVTLKHKHLFRIFFAIKDDRKLLGKIFPGYTANETKEKLNQYTDVVKVGAVWNGKPAEYFLLEAPKTDTALYISDAHPKIEGVQQAYNQWQGHVESWLEKHYSSKWQDHLDRAIEEENNNPKRRK